MVLPTYSNTVICGVLVPLREFHFYMRKAQCLGSGYLGGPETCCDDFSVAVSFSLTACWSAVLCMMFVPQHEARSEMSEREVARLQKMLERMEGGLPHQAHSRVDTFICMLQPHSSQQAGGSNNTVQLSQH